MYLALLHLAFKQPLCHSQLATLNVFVSVFESGSRVGYIPPSLNMQFPLHLLAPALNLFFYFYFLTTTKATMIAITTHETHSPALNLDMT